MLLQLSCIQVKMFANVRPVDNLNSVERNNEIAVKRKNGKSS